jgi:hypothetical protein
MIDIIVKNIQSCMHQMKANATAVGSICSDVQVDICLLA